MNLNHTLKPGMLALSAMILLAACKKDEPAPQMVDRIPEFYQASNEAVYGSNAPAITIQATADDDLNIPQDLDFHPNRFMELWVINKDVDMTGGSTVTISNAGSDNQSFDFRRDGNAWHFMALPSAMAFSTNGNWASVANIRDANRQGGTFTGPSLWSSDMNIYARPSGGNGSHLDMLHGSPFGMGIAAEKDNAFWVFDGFYGHLVRYDFAADHGPGNDDHSDGKVHRYTEVKLTRNGDLPSHMVLDGQKKWLYIVDGTNQRVIRVNIQTGSKKGDMNLINEPLAEHWEMQGVQSEVINIPGLANPVGIEIRGNRLFVSDYESGDIVAVNVDNNEVLGRISTGKKGICGIKVGPDNKLWFVNALSNELGRVDPR